MPVRLSARGSAYVVGSSKNLLNPSVTFKHGPNTVTVTFPGGEALELEAKEVPAYGKVFRVVNAMNVLVDDTDLPESLYLMAESGEYRPLVVLLRGIVARIYRAIRYYGYSLEMPDISDQRVLDVQDAEADLHWWLVEVSRDGLSWNRVIASPTESPIPFFLLSRFPGALQFGGGAEIKMSFWSDVVEALEDQKDPPAPEQEFLLNATAHRRDRNYRLAVMEAVIGLEIVLTDYIRNYLSVHKKVPKNRVASFVSKPEIGLTARVSGLLDMTLHESYIKTIEFDKVLKVIEWRNGIVHKSGRLPKELTNDTLDQHIQAVINLVEMLAERRINIAAEPSLASISQALGGMGNILQPMIWLEPRHHVRLDVTFILSEDAEALEQKMKDIAGKAGELLRARDGRCDPTKHLTIHFVDISNKSLAWFRRDTLVLSSESNRPTGSGLGQSGAELSK